MKTLWIVLLSLLPSFAVGQESAGVTLRGHLYNGPLLGSPRGEDPEWYLLRDGEAPLRFDVAGVDGVGRFDRLPVQISGTEQGGGVVVQEVAVLAWGLHGVVEGTLERPEIIMNQVSIGWHVPTSAETSVELHVPADRGFDLPALPGLRVRARYTVRVGFEPGHLTGDLVTVHNELESIVAYDADGAVVAVQGAPQGSLSYADGAWSLQVGAVSLPLDFSGVRAVVGEHDRLRLEGAWEGGTWIVSSVTRLGEFGVDVLEGIADPTGLPFVLEGRIASHPVEDGEVYEQWFLRTEGLLLEVDGLELTPARLRALGSRVLRVFAHLEGDGALVVDRLE